MSKTEKLRSETSALRTKYREAKNELDKLLQRRDSIDSELNNAYNSYIQAQADQKAGDVSNKDVTTAEKGYLKLKDEKEKLSDSIEVAEKVGAILKEKVTTSEYELSQQARTYYAEKVASHFTKIDKALSVINDEIESINGYRKGMQSDKVSDSFLKGIDRNSQALISKGKLASIQTKNFITQNKLIQT